MAWKFLSALFGPGKETPFRPAPPSRPSGRVREVTLRKLGETGSPESLPYLLLRLRDWADQVVNLAQDLLPQIAIL